MKETDRPLDELNRIGLETLIAALGSADAERFIEHCRTGIRDYTEERHSWLDQLRREDVLRDIEEIQSGGGAGADHHQTNADDKPDPSPCGTRSHPLVESVR